MKTVENQIEKDSIIWIYRNRRVDICTVISIYPDIPLAHIFNLEVNRIWTVDFKDVIRVGGYISDTYREYSKMKDEIVKIAGSRTKGFTKKELQDIFNRLSLRLNWNRFYYKISKYDLGLYFDKGAWHYDDSSYYRKYVTLIHTSNETYFGMAMGALSHFIKDNRELIKEIFPLEDFKIAEKE